MGKNTGKIFVMYLCLLLSLKKVNDEGLNN